MRRPRQFLGLGAAVVVAGALAVSAAASLSSDGKSVLAPRVDALRIGYAATDPTAATTRKAKKVGITVADYRGLNHTLGPGASYAAHVNCPAKVPHAISGYFNTTSPQVVLSGSVPVGARGWGIAVTNLSSTAQQYYRGVVCAR